MKAFIFSQDDRSKIIDPNFRPYRARMISVEEKEHSPKGETVSITNTGAVVGEKFLLSCDELSKNPYSCGYTIKPQAEGRRKDWALTKAITS